MAYDRRDFYRHARYVHAWLSAFAFVMLMFFASTGLLLNNPTWLADWRSPPPEQLQLIPLSKVQMQQLQASNNPANVLWQILSTRQVTVGRLQSSEVIDGDIMLRLQSPAGESDVFVAANSNQIEVRTKAASSLSLLNELHRGKNTSAAWSWLIDISAMIILLLSVAGFVLFLTLKGRLLSHVLLILISVIVLMLLIYGAV